MLYWVGVTSSWLPFADSVLGNRAPAWGTLMVGLGLMAWFTTLIVIVRFIPHRVGATFFRLANAILPDPSGLRNVLCGNSVPSSPTLKHKAQRFEVRQNCWTHPVSAAKPAPFCSSTGSSIEITPRPLASRFAAGLRRGAP